MKMKRIFLIVLDSFGIGELPDAEKFGDCGANTLKSCAKTGKLDIPNMIRLGIGNINAVSDVPSVNSPAGAFGKLAEKSGGKDTTVGHWEIAGLISDSPFPTYPNGFPESVIEKIEEVTGRRVLCNKPYSGTEVILDYGREHEKSGALIVYTSADSVLQIAANESIIPMEEQYDICRKVRGIMQGCHGVGRVIARPYIGEYPNYTRTSNRRDFSLEPGGVTMLDEICGAGLDVVAVGKIDDIFVGRGITKAIHTNGNSDGLRVTSDLAKTDLHGLCFVNLVDFDSLYGHRNDPEGYAKALSEFDAWLGGFIEELGDEDVVIITADHGCDPDDGEKTDHTREYVPLLVYGKGIVPTDLGIRASFSDISATVTELLGVEHTGSGRSFAEKISSGIIAERLISAAESAAGNAYSPYSDFCVGAALLCSDGEIFTGCNIENASYSATVCAERTAFFKALSEGKREFTAIAVTGGKREDINRNAPLEMCPPCGVCRQVMAEFCDGDKFKVILSDRGEIKTFSLNEILPLGFGKHNIC